MKKGGRFPCWSVCLDDPGRHLTPGGPVGPPQALPAEFSKGDGDMVCVMWIHADQKG